jgi:hypothetical protein
MANQSVVVVVADANLADANSALAAYYGDDPGSQNISVPLSASGQAPATHWGSHIWLSPTRATDIKDWPSGVLPQPASEWENHGLDATSALAAGASFIVSVMAATDQNFQNLPVTNFMATISAMGLQRIM